MLADLINVGYLALSERADSFMLRGDTLKDRRWGGCLTCDHRAKDGFCEVFRVKREANSPVGVCCVDYYRGTAQEPSEQYVSLSDKDVFVPHYTVVVPNQETTLLVR